MTTKSQQPGGLTDSQWNVDPKQSFRDRNWFSTPWLVPAVSAEYVFNEKTKLSWKSLGTVAERNSVGFTKAITTMDDLSNRQIDRDFYTTYGSEIRLLTDYQFLGLNHTLAAGLRYFKGRIDRKQLGSGSTGGDMNFELDNGIFPRNLDFTNTNQAVFLENVFRLSDQLLFTGGIRLEQINSQIEGRLNVVNGQEVYLTPTNRKRNFVLLGAGAEYHITPRSEFYSNISQAYRPVIMSDLTPPATTDVIDENLQDAHGYNFDFGYRGKVSNYLNYPGAYKMVISQNGKIKVSTIERL